MDKVQPPKIEIDRYAIRFLDETGQRNFFFSDMIHDGTWGYKVLKEIHNMYEQCLLFPIEPETNKECLHCRKEECECDIIPDMRDCGDK